MNQNLRIFLIVIGCCLAIIKVIRLFVALDRTVGPTVHVEAKPQPTWNETYKQQVADAVYIAADTLLVEERQKRTLANCAADRIKNLFPNGINNVPKDSLVMFYPKVISSCLGTMKTIGDTPMLRWTRRDEQLIHKQITKTMGKTAGSEKFCSCLLTGLRNKYSVTGVPGEVDAKTFKRAKDSCVVQMFK